MLLAAQALTKRYGSGSGYEATRSASLELRAGEYVSIVGRSGSGKSTLLAMLGGLTRPTHGRAVLDGTDLWALSESELAAFRCRYIGFVFQFPSLLSNLTALDNVALPALLGHTMTADEAYAQGSRLLAQLGLAGRADTFPGDLSGGEQRRVAIARALVNSPLLLLADEPTSDLDEETEAEIIEVLEQQHREKKFGLVLVTHNVGLARHAQCVYEMRQGVLAPAVLPSSTQPYPRRVRPAAISPSPAPSSRADAGEAIALGANLWRSLRLVAVAGVGVLAAILVGDRAVAKYQQMQLQERGARIAKLADLALSELQSEIQSITDLGDGRYELAIALFNADNGRPLYVMSPDMRAYVQVGQIWQEVPLKSADDEPGNVLKIDDRHTYRYHFDAHLREFAQLLPNYMHVRFSATILVSPSSTPKDDVFERKDNYYVYLKPSDVADETILKRIKFSGKPPVWIPMPPH